MRVLVIGFAIAFILTACKKEQPVAPGADSPLSAQPDATRNAQMVDGPTPSDAGGSDAQLVDAGPSVEEVEIADADAATARGYAVAGDFLWLLTPPESDKPEVAAGRKRLASVQGVSWCEADEDAGLIWYLDDQGVHAYDTTTATTHAVVKHPEAGAFDAVVIDYAGQASMLASGDGLGGGDTGVKLTMGPTPTVEPHVLCTGDRWVYCYESMDGDDPKDWQLFEEQAAAFELARLARIDDPELVKTAYGRAVDYKTKARPTAPAAPRVEVDASRCDADPEACGAARWVGGHFWSVTTDNSRGDYFHETEQLFDSRSKEFIDPDKWQRSREPLEDVESVNIVSSHERRFAFINGSLIDLQTGRNLWEGSIVNVCGWL